MKPYFYAAENICQRKWATIEEAQAEAERYAEAHPGKTFEILRCVGIAQTSKASTFWVDDEEPPEKPRWRMLEIREVIESGDEYCNSYKCWHPTPVTGDALSHHHFPHRRPL